ncbi:uncharacterized protein BJ171DRAFT_256751 [Polychytrium aggregatum]|uniref:uncharacterized protein n=1 Tax=Polychytrium aggregatum TaxID=110093 RepID=UPI0022FDD1D9|nr:uncharacterized protein BJ171DRAFT_256751 [Polychytrium aggregatum]KAI9207874.1 hypothetical protein BJ171DRAFT_256751 [Polychytrium aggregatum]
MAAPKKSKGVKSFLEKRKNSFLSSVRAEPDDSLSNSEPSRSSSLNKTFELDVAIPSGSLLFDGSNGNAECSSPTELRPADIRPADMRPAEPRPAELRSTELRPSLEVPEKKFTKFNLALINNQVDSFLHTGRISMDGLKGKRKKRTRDRESVRSSTSRDSTDQLSDVQVAVQVAVPAEAASPKTEQLVPALALPPTDPSYIQLDEYMGWRGRYTPRYLSPHKYLKSKRLSDSSLYSDHESDSDEDVDTVPGAAATTTATNTAGTDTSAEGDVSPSSSVKVSVYAENLAEGVSKPKHVDGSRADVPNPYSDSLPTIESDEESDDEDDGPHGRHVSLLNPVMEIEIPQIAEQVLPKRIIRPRLRDIAEMSVIIRRTQFGSDLELSPVIPTPFNITKHHSISNLRQLAPELPRIHKHQSLGNLHVPPSPRRSQDDAASIHSNQSDVSPSKAMIASFKQRLAENRQLATQPKPRTVWHLSKPADQNDDWNTGIENCIRRANEIRQRETLQMGKRVLSVDPSAEIEGLDEAMRNSLEM